MTAARECGRGLHSCRPPDFQQDFISTESLETGKPQCGEPGKPWKSWKAAVEADKKPENLEN
jgi:hypothetical protein